MRPSPDTHHNPHSPNNLFYKPEFKNGNNNCWFTTTIWFLGNLPGFITTILNNNLSSIIYEKLSIIFQLKNNIGSLFTGGHAKELIDVSVRNYMPGEQRDATEMVETFIHKYEEKINKTTFTILYEETKTCSLCQTSQFKMKNTYQTIIDIAKHKGGPVFPLDTIKTIIEKSPKNCITCQGLTVHNINKTMKQYPEILIVQVMNSKLSHDLRLEMERGFEDGRVVYELFSYITHYGNVSDSGHYFYTQVLDDGTIQELDSLKSYRRDVPGQKSTPSLIAYIKKGNQEYRRPRVETSKLFKSKKQERKITFLGAG